MSCENCLGNIFQKRNWRESIKQKDIMIIGDIPTIIDVRKNTCMSGRAVGILKQTLQKVNIDLNDCYFTTAIKCAYPKIKGKQVPNELILNCHSSHSSQGARH